MVAAREGKVVAARVVMTTREVVAAGRAVAAGGRRYGFNRSGRCRTCSTTTITRNGGRNTGISSRIIDVGRST